ncbi:MAG: hypothetical protein JNL67_05480 [Planctomycetaceae bacterium]|nr:hypothetical protein [Planctomycetaceae bacterium]
MNQLWCSRPLIVLVLGISSLLGCENGAAPAQPSAAPVTTPWLGIPSAINQVIVFLHEGTGWLLDKSEVSVKKSSEVRKTADDSSELVADFQISVKFGDETFETTAKDVPCDNDGIPTEAAVERLRTAVEDIKSKMKRLQN